MNERLLKIMESLGFPTDNANEEMIADAMESMVYALDKLAEAHDHYAVQINAYCIELEDDINVLARQVDALERNKVACTCSVISKTMRELM